MKIPPALAALCSVALMLGVLRAEDRPPPAPAVELEHTEKRTLHSELTATTHHLSINLPADYANSGKTYPVLYVLDGVWNFPMLVGIQDSLVYGGRIPSVITVAIDYGLPYAELLQRRELDFTPTAWAKFPASGHAPQLLAFIEKELIPFIDKTYRTQPQDRALLGHSYGGLFGVYAWLERPQLFQRIVASSPSLRWDDELLTKWISKEGRRPDPQSPARLHLSMGGAEDSDHVAATLRFVEELKKTSIPREAWTFGLYPDENHTTMKPVSFTQGLGWAYRP